jgi:hypothetical protein
LNFSPNTILGVFHAPKYLNAYISYTSILSEVVHLLVELTGYSITSGAICSGTTEAITFLGGCTSVYGYSTATSAPCNGTQSATLYGDPVVTPGLPTTGVLGLSLTSSILLGLLGLLSIGGIVYATRKTQIA